MSTLFRFALSACVAMATFTGSASAAQIFLSGIATEDLAPNVSPWTLVVDYTPSTTAGDYTAAVTAADFRVNRGGTWYQWNVLKVSSQNEIRISLFKTAYDLGLRFQGPANQPAGATTGQFQADINLTVGGGTQVSLREATQVNIEALTDTSTVVNGNFLVDTQSPFNSNSRVWLDGTPLGIAVPEPGSLLLLSGLGLFAGRRVISRRRQQKAQTTEAAAV